MEHLEEGEIHAWLDGQLSADRGAEIERHSAGCAECAARVAEARGFIAASSRILSALDDVPGDVIPALPAAAPDDLAVRRQAGAKRRRFSIPISAAAAVLVAVLGTFTWSNVGRERATQTLEVPASVAEKSQETAREAVTSSTPTIIAPTVPPRPSLPVVANAAPRRAEADASAAPADRVGAGALGAVAQSASPREAQAEAAPSPPPAVPADEDVRRRRDRAPSMAAAPIASAAASAAPGASAGRAMAKAAASDAVTSDSVPNVIKGADDVSAIAGCYRIEGTTPQRFLDLRVTVLPEERDPTARVLFLRGGGAVERASWAFSGQDSVRLELGRTSLGTTVRARIGADGISGITESGQPFRAGRTASCSR